MNASIPQPDNNLPEDDRELLSAYLDDELAPAERSRLEQRLQAEPALYTELEELQDTRSLLANLPALTPPRSFTLDAQNPPPRRFTLAAWLSGLLGSTVLQRAGGAMAAVLLIVVVSVGFLTFLGGQQVNTVFSGIDSGLDGGYAASEPQATAGLPAATAEEEAAEEAAPAEAAAMAEQEAPAAGDAPPEAAEAPQAPEIDQVAPARSPADEEAEEAAPADQAALAEEQPTPTPAPTQEERELIATTMPSLVVLPTPSPLDEATGGRMAPQQEEAVPAEDDAASPMPGTIVPPGVGASDTSSPDTNQLADGQQQAPDRPQARPAAWLSNLLLAVVILVIMGAAVGAWLVWRRRA